MTPFLLPLSSTPFPLFLLLPFSPQTLVVYISIFEFLCCRRPSISCLSHHIWGWLGLNGLDLKVAGRDEVVWIPPRLIPGWTWVWLNDFVGPWFGGWPWKNGGGRDAANKWFDDDRWKCSVSRFPYHLWGSNCQFLNDFSQDLVAREVSVRVVYFYCCLLVPIGWCMGGLGWWGWVSMAGLWWLLI